jgi:hypothetical protein
MYGHRNPHTPSPTQQKDTVSPMSHEIAEETCVILQWAVKTPHAAVGISADVSKLLSSFNPEEGGSSLEKSVQITHSTECSSTTLHNE